MAKKITLFVLSFAFSLTALSLAMKLSDRLFFGTASVDTGAYQTGKSAQTLLPANTIALPKMEQNGITLGINGLRQEADETVVQLNVDNHAQDLSSASIYEAALLNGKRARSFAFLAEPGIGHHIAVEIRFPRAESGALEIAPTKETRFKIDNVWK